MSGKGKGRNFSQAEVGGIDVDGHAIPSAVGGCQGRVSHGYPLKDRKDRWKRVHWHMAQKFKDERTVSDQNHWWADVVFREVDVVDLLGLEVRGSAGDATTAHYVRKSSPVPKFTLLITVHNAHGKTHAKGIYVWIG
ncbi:hypothetical protein NDU88_001741 [Pleurodeles waltl]|uniref:Uncharacterized protein n=1 Tax=Pleurodeles waltl TaxID=8319 RepID=A0AAV7PC28_PLEWA|nr:hypothetical protein NDU88_001741 [Pleurodeles waltl]